MSGADLMQTDPETYWNQEAGPRWIAAQPLLDRIFAPLTERLISAADPGAGERVVDVGCGSATLVIELAGRVGPAGHVIGCDISEPLIAHARARTADLDNVELVRADAATHRFASGVDLIASRFGVMFFTDSIAAFTNLRRAVAPGGRLAFVCWREAERNPWITRPLRAIADMLEPAPPPGGDVPGPFRFADGKYLRHVLERSGFSDIDLEPVDHRLRFDGSLDELMALFQRVGPLSRALDTLGEEKRARAVELVRDDLGAEHAAGGIGLDAATWLVRAAPG
jgi:SAM-dependent methyltransferase